MIDYSVCKTKSQARKFHCSVLSVVARAPKPGKCFVKAKERRPKSIPTTCVVDLNLPLSVPVSGHCVHKTQILSGTYHHGDL